MFLGFCLGFLGVLYVIFVFVPRTMKNICVPKVFLVRGFVILVFLKVFLAFVSCVLATLLVPFFELSSLFQGVLGRLSLLSGSSRLPLQMVGLETVLIGLSVMLEVDDDEAA